MSLIRSNSNSLSKNESLADAAGNTLLYSGGAVVGLGLAAALLPVITLPMVAGGALVGGVILKMKAANKG